MTLELTKAIEFLRLHDILDLPDGKIGIEGERVLAIVQHYETIKTHAPTFEYHQKYIDVQYIASGEEIIGWAPIARMTVTEPYDADKDICFGTVTKGSGRP
jgi:YhcH/YjgK/YiaL family protein